MPDNQVLLFGDKLEAVITADVIEDAVLTIRLIFLPVGMLLIVTL
jgi:hypothetical protein